MSEFTTPLIVEIPNTGLPVILREAFEYHVGIKGSGDVIKVPEGFLTDFASVPRFFWRILPPLGAYGKAAVIHDYLYVTQTRRRKEADSIFLEAMAVLGVPRWKRNAMYRGVRLGGGGPWKKRAKELNENK